jgi:hypothetical protein
MLFRSVSRVKGADLCRFIGGCCDGCIGCKNISRGIKKFAMGDECAIAYT